MSKGTRKTAADFLKQLQGVQGGLETGLESGGTSGTDLSSARRQESRAALADILARNAAGVDNVDEAAIDTFLEEADTALSKLAQEGPEATLTPMQEYALEAVVETDGSRPSIAMIGDEVDLNDPRLKQWQGYASDFRREIRRAAQATARLLINGVTADHSVAGTAWMIAPGLAATAKHVVEQNFEPLGDGRWAPTFGKTLTLDFHVEANAAPRPDARIGVCQAIWASGDVIGNALNLANLDVAVLQLDAEGPPPLQLASTLSFPAGPACIHVIGHPLRPQSLGTAWGAELDQLRDLVFGGGFGCKRWSPGIIRVGPGRLPEDVNGHVMTHDASTLGGNSGSAVLDLVTFGDRAIGLHYGGYFEKENYAHPTEAMKAHLQPLAPDHQMFV